MFPLFYFSVFPLNDKFLKVIQSRSRVKCKGEYCENLWRRSLKGVQTWLIDDKPLWTSQDRVPARKCTLLRTNVLLMIYLRSTHGSLLVFFESLNVEILTDDVWAGLFRSRVAILSLKHFNQLKKMASSETKGSLTSWSFFFSSKDQDGVSAIHSVTTYYCSYPQ